MPIISFVASCDNGWTLQATAIAHAAGSSTPLPSQTAPSKPKALPHHPPGRRSSSRAPPHRHKRPHQGNGDHVHRPRHSHTISDLTTNAAYTASLPCRDLHLRMRMMHIRGGDYLRTRDARLHRAQLAGHTMALQAHYASPHLHAHAPHQIPLGPTPRAPQQSAHRHTHTPLFPPLTSDTDSRHRSPRRETQPHCR